MKTDKREKYCTPGNLNFPFSTAVLLWHISQQSINPHGSMATPQLHSSNVLVDRDVNIAEHDFDAVQLNRKAATCNRNCRFSYSISKKMIVRMLIRLCLLNTLFSLFIQENRLVVDAKLCNMAASASGKASHGSFKDPIDHVEMINARVETSRLLADTLKIRGGQAIVGKKIKVLYFTALTRA